MFGSTTEKPSSPRSKARSLKLKKYSMAFPMRRYSASWELSVVVAEDEEAQVLLKGGRAGELRVEALVQVGFPPEARRRRV